MLSCFKYKKYLSAYLDGNLDQSKRKAVTDHLTKCPVCQKQLEELRNLEGVLDIALPVPPVPDGLTAKIMQEVRRRKDQEAAGKSKNWNPLDWFAGLSIPMRIATFFTILLAVFLGLSMSSARQDKMGRDNNNLYGLEWFETASPDSIYSIYVSLDTQTYQEGN